MKIQANESKARWYIGIFSFVVFAAVVILGRVKLDINPGFDVHIFAKINACINGLIAVLLVLALLAIKRKKVEQHRQLMLGSLVLSILFLVSYIIHHLLAGETTFGGIGTIKMVYYIILVTHIFLAAVILPFILFTAYRALAGEIDKHRKLARITWPVWLYVAITGPVVYLMISPYYQ